MRARAGFTLLEIVLVLFIIALVLAAVHSLAQGALMLAEDVRREQRRDARQQAFAAYAERLLAGLPAAAALNLRTTQEDGRYLSSLELHGVPSPFNGMPDQIVRIFTETAPGGGVRLMLSCGARARPDETARVMLFESLSSCEWRAYDPATRQWTTLWSEPLEVSVEHIHPPLLELVTTGPAGDISRRVFWVAPGVPPVY